MALSLPYSLPRFSFFHKNPPISPKLCPTPMLKTSIDLLKFPVIRCSTEPNNPITLNPRKDSKTQSGSALSRPLQAADAAAISTGTPTEAYATGRHISMSANKVRRAIDQIRGRSYEESLMILELMPYRACYPILKLVYSAAANASHNLGFNKANLVISKAVVNEGTTRKRIRPQSRGRAHPIRKRTCHITVAVKESD